MGQSNRNWQRRWVLSDDGLSAVHQSGLCARFDNHRVIVDDASRDEVMAIFAADAEQGRHAGARVSRLLLEADMLFRRPRVVR